VAILGSVTGSFASADDIDEVQVGAEDDSADGDAASIQARNKRAVEKIERTEALKATRAAELAQKRAAEQKTVSAEKIGLLEPKIALMQAERRIQEKRRLRSEKIIADQQKLLSDTEAKLAKLQGQVEEGKRLAAERDLKIGDLNRRILAARAQIKQTNQNIASQKTSLKVQADRQKRLEVEAAKTRQPSSR
jgi:hypothetical protein